jgi:D-alanine-D-alanine ligase
VFVDYMQAEHSIYGRPTRSKTMAERKTRVAILFGGRSAEHDVSRASAANVLRSLDPNRYDVTLIGIARDGRWIVADAGNGAGIGAVALAIPDDGPQLTLLPGGHGRALALEPNTAGFAGV